MHGLAHRERSRPTRSPGTGSLDVLRYGRVAARPASWSACAAPGWPTTASTTSRASRTRSSAASTSRASRSAATGSISIVPEGACHERDDEAPTQRYYGKYRGTVVQQHRPDADGRLHGPGPGRARARPSSSWAMPCAAGRRDPVGRLRRARRSAPASGSSSSRATPTTRSGRAAAGGSAPRCRRWRSPACPRARTSCSRPPARTTLVISDVPGPTGGIMLRRRPAR